MFDIARELEAAKFMPAGDFLFAAGDPALIRDFAPGAQTLEGFLFPATYELPTAPCGQRIDRRDGAQVQGGVEAHCRTSAANGPSRTKAATQCREPDRDAGIARGKGNAEAGRTPTCGRRIRKSPAQRHAPAMRPHRDLWNGALRKIQWDADGQGPELRFAVQHLRARWAPARAHRKSRRSFAARRAAAGANELSIFRGQHPGRPFFQRYTGGTQQKCGEVSSAAGGPAGGSTPPPPPPATPKKKHSKQSKQHRGTAR